MKIDLFENKYKTSKALKIFFVDVVCFLLTAVISIGVCYAYFSSNVSVKGNAAMAQVTVEYQAKVGQTYQAVDYVHAIINGNENSTEEEAVSLNNVVITPGDTITVVGRAVSTSSVSVFVLARLNIEVQKIGKSTSTVKTVWFNIGANDPDPENGIVATPTIQTDEQIRALTIGENGLYNIGAGSLGALQYKELRIPYTFEGTEYNNGDTIKSVSLRLHVYQKNYLETADDFNLYKEYATGITNNTPNGFINGYTTESVYAAHHITETLIPN